MLYAQATLDCSDWLQSTSLVFRACCFQVEEMVELKPIQHSLVCMPGRSGLSVEQRKRLTIAVELVWSPSIIFMDEPTSGCHAVMYYAVPCVGGWVKWGLQ